MRTAFGGVFAEGPRLADVSGPALSASDAAAETCRRRRDGGTRRRRRRDGGTDGGTGGGTGGGRGRRRRRRIDRRRRFLHRLCIENGPDGKIVSSPLIAILY